MKIAVINNRLYPFRTNREMTQFMRNFKCNGIIFYDFTVSGYDYEQKKLSAITQCKEVVELMKRYDVPASAEWTIQSWISNKAVSYGLLKDFREEGIL